MIDSDETFDVIGQNENQRRKNIILAFRVYVKCLKYMKLVKFYIKCNNEWHLVVNLLESILIPEL